MKQAIAANLLQGRGRATGLRNSGAATRPVPVPRATGRGPPQQVFGMNQEHDRDPGKGNSREKDHRALVVGGGRGDVRAETRKAHPGQLQQQRVGVERSQTSQARYEPGHSHATANKGEAEEPGEPECEDREQQLQSQFECRRLRGIALCPVCEKSVGERWDEQGQQNDADPEGQAERYSRPARIVRARVISP